MNVNPSSLPPSSSSSFILESAKTSINPVDNSDDVKLGQYTFKKIPYDALEPGDIVCTYESTSTVDTSRMALEFQKMVSPGSRQDIHKMLHVEIIVAKHPRVGCYTIAHASGFSKKVEKSDENFKTYEPGQALMVFRTTDETVKKSIIEVATKTAESNDHPWTLRMRDIYNKAGLFKFIQKFFQLLKIEYSGSRKVEDKTWTKIARLAVDFEDQKKFLKKDNSTKLSMSCVEYAANVINVAIVRVTFSGILKDKTLTKEEKINLIAKDLKISHLSEKERKKKEKQIQTSNHKQDPEIEKLALKREQLRKIYQRSPETKAKLAEIIRKNQANEFLTEAESELLGDTQAPAKLKPVIDAPFKFSHGLTSSSSFINFLLNSDTFTNVGYIGSIANELPDDYVEREEISRHVIPLALSNQLIDNNKDPKEVLKILRGLNLLTDTHHIRLNNAKDTAKISAAFTHLYAFNHKISSAEVASFIKFSAEERAAKLKIFKQLKEQFEIFKKLSLSPAETYDPELLKQLTVLGDLTTKLEKKGVTKKEKFIKEMDEDSLKEVFIQLYLDNQKQVKPKSSLSLDKRILADILEDKISSYENCPAAFGQFKERMHETVSQSVDKKSKLIDEKIPHYHKFSAKEILGLLRTERGFIKESQAPDKNFKLSINFLEQERIKSTGKNSLANRLVIAGGIGALILPPVGIILLSVGLALKLHSTKVEAAYKDWQNRVREVNNRLGPDAVFNLKVNDNDISKDQRPWIHYQTKDGKWHDEPLLEGLYPNEWYTQLKIEEKFIYKLYKGPKNINDNNPTRHAVWQKTNNNEDVKVSDNLIKWDREKNIRQIPICDRPSWL